MTWLVVTSRCGRTPPDRPCASADLAGEVVAGQGAAEQVVLDGGVDAGVAGLEVLYVAEGTVEGHHAGAVQGLVHDELAGVRHGRVTGPADHQQRMVVVDRGRRL